MRSYQRCTSRLWTPENGTDSWFTCARRDAHHGTHRAAGERWSSSEAMGAPVPASPLQLPQLSHLHLHLPHRRQHVGAGHSTLKAG